MALPSGFPGHQLVADGAETVLFLPEMEEPLFSFEGCLHVSVVTLFKVGFPERIIWVGFTLDLDVPFDGHMAGLGQIAGLLVDLAVKHPVVSSQRREVFLRDPGVGFAGVSPFHPLFHRLIDSLIYMVKGLLAHDMSVVIGPASDHAIEAKDHYSGRESFVGLYALSNLLKEGFDILLGRFDQQLMPFARLVLAYILTKEIEAFFDVRNEGFLWREMKSSFLHELLHEGFDFVFQQLLGVSCDHKVIGKSNVVDFRAIGLASSFRAKREGFSQLPFQAIESHICDHG